MADIIYEIMGWQIGLLCWLQYLYYKMFLGTNWFQEVCFSEHTFYFSNWRFERWWKEKERWFSWLTWNLAQSSQSLPEDLSEIWPCCSSCMHLSQAAGGSTLKWVCEQTHRYCNNPFSIKRTGYSFALFFSIWSFSIKDGKVLFQG